MASQWSRLRSSHQWLHRASLVKTSTRFQDSSSWLAVAGALGGVASSAFFLAESPTSSNDADNNKSGKTDEGSLPSRIRAPSSSVGAPESTQVAPLFALPRINLPFQRPPQLCQCESVARLSSLGRTSQLRRNKTIVQYKDEVCQQSLRSMYKVDWKKPLGQGGFGAVYQASDRKTGEKVALKQISKKYTDDVGFQREMEAFMHLRRAGGHPNICGLRENFDEGNYFYFSLDLISGGEMFDHLIANGPYSEQDAARLMQEVASALSFMHGIGFVHG